MKKRKTTLIQKDQEKEMLPKTTTISHVYHLCGSCWLVSWWEKFMHTFLRRMCYQMSRRDAGKAHEEWRTNSWLTSRIWSTVRNTSKISQWDELITKRPMIWCRMVRWLKLWKWWGSQTTLWTYFKTAKRHGEQGWQHVMKVLGKLILEEEFFKEIFLHLCFL